MDCRDVEGLLPAYALDALDAEESAAVEAHLDACPWCPALLREHVQVAAALAQAAGPLEPPPALKYSVTRALEARPPGRERPRRPLRIGGNLALAAAASVAVLLLGAATGMAVHLTNEMDDLQQENADLASRVSLQVQEDDMIEDMVIEQRSVNYLLASSSQQATPLRGGGTVPRAEGVFITSGGDWGTLMARGLVPSSGDEAYHVMLKRDGEPVAVGRLSVDRNGMGVLTMWTEEPMTVFQQVWVVEEPAQSNPTPVLWGVISSK